MENKSKKVILFLAIFFGFIGIHRFYVGKTKTGLVYLFTCGLFFVGWIVDIIVILNDKFTDINGNYISDNNCDVVDEIGALDWDDAQDYKSLLKEQITELQKELEDEEHEDILIEKVHSAINYEKAGNIEKAINLYEECISENFDGSHPYNRLAIIYRKQRKYKEEERVLKKAIYVFEKVVNKKRGDRDKKLENYKSRLSIVQDKYLNRNI